MAINYVDIDNQVLAFVDDADDTANLVKWVAGTPTYVISGAITPVNGHELKVIVASDGVTYSLYYNGVQIGASQAINDAMGTEVYGFVTDAENTPGTVTTSKAVS